ncbi:MAG: hypothetical protein U5M50_10575 [Sphingobium sp.]|nr:hypothetical protein [Sphingobium sp.]
MNIIGKLMVMLAIHRRGAKPHEQLRRGDHVRCIADDFAMLCSHRPKIGQVYVVTDLELNGAAIALAGIPDHWWEAAFFRKLVRDEAGGATEIGQMIRDAAKRGRPLEVA